MNHAETATPVLVRAMPRLMIGLTIMALGLLWTLDNLDVLDARPITRWWPVALIVIGLVRLLDPRANKFTSALISFIGVGFLLDRLNVWDFDLGDLFPMFIAVIGAKLVIDVFRRRSAQPLADADADSVVHAFAVMSGVGRRSVSSNFHGGDANAIMGGVELDLRSAQIRDGEQAVLDVFALWGGIEIKVPENWRVVSEVFPLMGAFEDKTRSRTLSSGPVLVVRGVVMMGACEVKNLADASTAQ